MGSVNEPQFICKFCGKELGRVGDYRNHLKKVHPKEHAEENEKNNPNKGRRRGR